MAAERVGASLLVTAGVKAWLVARELLAFPSPSPSLRAAGFFVVVAGLGLAVWFAYPLSQAKVLRELRWTRVEWALGVLLVIGIIGLNVPLVLPGAFS
jgi:hypothetical protein